MIEYEKVFHKFSVSAFILNEKYEIIDINESMSQLFGNRNINFNSTKCYELLYTSEKPCWKSGNSTCPVKNSFKSGEKSRAILRHKTTRGEIVHEVIAIPIREKQGEVFQVLVEYHSSVQEFRGLITMCSSCNKIRMESGKWKSVEGYIESHTTAEISHGYCEECDRMVRRKRI